MCEILLLSTYTLVWETTDSFSNLQQVTSKLLDASTPYVQDGFWQSARSGPSALLEPSGLHFIQDDTWVSNYIVARLRVLYTLSIANYYVGSGSDTDLFNNERNVWASAPCKSLIESIQWCNARVLNTMTCVNRLNFHAKIVKHNS